MGNKHNPSPAAAPLYRGRLMRDINELCKPPCYPNIKLHPPVDGPDGMMGDACLLLTTKAYGDKPLHLTVQFPHDFPVAPPHISMDTPNVSHPNVFGNYICASILNTTEGYTSAYTLKGIAIQLLSFFSSDSVEQIGGGVVHLGNYQEQMAEVMGWHHQQDEWAYADDTRYNFKCDRCCYDTGDQASMLKAADTEPATEYIVRREAEAVTDVVETSSPQDLLPSALAGRSIDMLTDDVLLLILRELDTTGINKFVAASDRVRQLVEYHDVLHQRELQCFCLKTSYLKSDLGVGVSTMQSRTRTRGLESEFDLLSREAFATLRVRRSVQSIAFDHWLPLPLSRRHWLRVRNDAVVALVAIGEDALPRKKGAFKREPVGTKNGRQPNGAQLVHFRQVSKTAPTPESVTRATEVLLSFMTQIVVRLNEDVDKLNESYADEWWLQDDWVDHPSGPVKSTLRHASEKAIESYFHLFHLLVCLAAEHPQVAADANHRLRSFYVNNKRSKVDCPNLGMLLVALLIADDSEIGVDNKTTDSGPGTRQDLLKSIITEAITRNVVWLLDTKGAGRAELVHLEAKDTISEYRLHHTFVGSQTSYRLLMFMELFRRTARPQGQSLEAVRDALYQRHGAPPAGAAAHLSAEVRRLQTIQTWPNFLEAMGVDVPSKSVFCNVLRKAVRDSMSHRYSVWGLTAAEAESLRAFHEDAFAQGASWQPPAIRRARPDRRRNLRGRGGRYGGGVGRTRPVTVDGALRDLAEEKYGHLARQTSDGPKWTSISTSERESAAYVKWRLLTKEVSFFPGGTAREARGNERRVWNNGR
ncbi:uncharacterized protein SPSK_07080 [Sporothrix schenckii 1099-18]|uniref:UBC core domain-containing protein n=1 Tax=Sporothrix schenckii 1099-18 TaxID=1397361 RepID=A0A0F2MDF1_SPOSC|nr:uncharacterized protein SPSK_07080 [Sporothrix schenckii 1099-18]KJR87713.1 hypothetical protein SPSK_07080 [Sporothrix schenckii 1099-18]